MTWRKISLLLCCLFPLPLCPVHAGEASAQGKTEERTLTVQGVERHFLVHVPPQADAKTPLPVVLMLHGGGGTGKGAVAETGWDRKADEAGFLAVFPDATRPAPEKPARFGSNSQVWNDGSGRFHAGEQNVDDVAFLSAILDDLCAHYPVNPRRIYVTGFSNGASMAFRAGAELSKRVAAIAPLAGASWQAEPKLERPVPVCYLTGTADPLNPLEGGEPKPAWGGAGIGGKKKPPVKDTILKWVKLNGCPEEPKPGAAPDGVKTAVYGPGRAGAEVVYVTIEGMGHVWPGGKNLLPEALVGKDSDKLNATAFIWEFFRTHPRPE